MLQAVSSVLYALVPSLALALHRGLMKQEYFDTGLPELKNCKKLNFFSLLIAQSEYSVVTVRNSLWVADVFFPVLHIFAAIFLLCLSLGPHSAFLLEMGHP